MTDYFYDSDVDYNDATWFYDGEYTPPVADDARKKRGIVLPSKKKKEIPIPFLNLTISANLAEVNGDPRDGDINVLKFAGETSNIVVLMQKIYKFNYKPLTYAELLENKSRTPEGPVNIDIQLVPQNNEVLITSVSLIKEENHVEPRIIIEA